MSRPHRVSPANVVAADFLDLLETVTPALENSWEGQAVLESIRFTQAELTRKLQGARWPPRVHREVRPEVSIEPEADQ